MTEFRPEGRLIDTPENQSALRSPASLAEAAREKRILEADVYKRQGSVYVESLSLQGEYQEYLSHIQNGDWAAYKYYDFDKAGVSSFTITFANGRFGASETAVLELRLDGPDGTVIGSAPLPPTGGWLDWKTFSCPVRKVQGVHGLYLVFRGNDGRLCSVSYTHLDVYKRQVYFLGKPLHIMLKDGKFPPYRKEGDLILSSERPEAQAVEWFREHAKRMLVLRTVALAQKYGFSFNGVRITSARGRYGSCNHKNGINLSWRIVMAPLETVDAVILHELCHTREHNHSSRFWTLLSSVCPDYDGCCRWLREHGLEDVYKRQGIISGGMIPKIDCCVDAVRRGVGRAHIIDGRIAHSILIELFTDEGIGTMFY